MRYFIIISLAILIGCGKAGEHNHNDPDSDGDDPNQALYNQVMDIHDDVMPKMDSIYSFKRQLLESLANNPAMPEAQKKDLNKMIKLLDSANKSMMDWMHGFSPPSDSTDQEVAREYYEKEMERIKQVRELMNESLQKAKDQDKK